MGTLPCPPRWQLAPPGSTASVVLSSRKARTQQIQPKRKFLFSRPTAGLFMQVN